MKTAEIKQTSQLIDSGCNACGIAENVQYTLVFDNQDISIDELTVNSLVTAIVSKSGFNYEYKMDELDDYIFYQKDQIAVTLKEEYDYLTYSNKQLIIETKDQIINQEKLTQKVNTILTTIFELEEVAFYK